MGLVCSCFDGLIGDSSSTEGKSRFVNGMLASPHPPPGQPGFDAAKLKAYIGATADLYAAAQAGDADACKIALAAGAEPGKPNHWKGNTTPLHAAAAAGSSIVCNLLLDAGGKGTWVEAVTGDWDGHSGETALVVAERYQRQDVADLFRSRGLAR
ncbi:unnamed protein product [Prorocentrum cordatum]|uniref:Ankyrin repeat domain-containing protein n=1 Tax=Prorocentrum cordatum TaxID=2364126 RepID=A0ABN9V3V3_9DINO|nr:unnamed protein product [Polarella glacialis]